MREGMAGGKEQKVSVADDCHAPQQSLEDRVGNTRNGGQSEATSSLNSFSNFRPITSGEAIRSTSCDSH